MKAVLAAFAFAGITALATSAGAAPIGHHGLGAEPAAATKVATYVCVRDDRGWHYMRGNRRVVCRPAVPDGGARVWGWHCEGRRCGWWHRREHRWND